MSNFTRSGGLSSVLQAIANYSCCSIDFITKQRSSIKALAFIMFFSFSVVSVSAQSERSTFFDLCQSDAPVGPSEADVANMYLSQCGDTPAEVIKTSVMTGNDCDWSVEYTYDIKCGAFEDEIKINYVGGDRTPPVLNDGAQVPVGATGLNLCFSQAPSGPKVSTIAGLYSDNCGEVIVTKSGSPQGDDCSWTANYKYTIMDTCGNAIADLDVNYSGGDTQEPQLNKGAQIPTGQTGLNLCYDEKPLGPTEEEIAALFSDNCGSVNVTKTLATEKGNDDCKWLSAFQYTIQDDCGNFAAPIFIEYMGGDSEDPVLSGVPANTEVSCIDEILAAANVTATDNCKDNIQVTLTENDDNLGLACEGGELIRTWTAMDDCGNMVSASQTIVVLPAPAAEFESVSPETISCEEAFSFQAPDLAYSNGITKSACAIQGTVPGTVTPDFTLCGGTITVNWTYTDECLRTINAEKVYTVTPAPAATLDTIENFSLTCEQADAYVASPLGYSNGLEGDCGINGSVEPLQKNQFDACGGKILVNYVGEDSCGNPLNATLDITVLPAPAAVFDPIEVESELSCADAATYAAAALNYSNGLEGICNISGSVDPVQTNDFDACGGKITITWTGQDDCENPLSASVDIDVLPAPEATVSGPELPDSISCADAAGFTVANGTYDNGLDGECNISGEIPATIVPDYDVCGGKLTITWSGQDECGRPLSAGPVEVLVDPAPEATLSTPEFPSNIACSDAAGFEAAAATYTNGLEGECNISGTLVANVVEAYDLCGGKITITYNGEDACGRPLSAGPFDVDVDPAPEASFDVEEHEDISCSEAANYQAGSLGYSNGIEGECGINGEVDGVLSGEFSACGGLLYVDWTYTDECGRTITARKQLKVAPAPAPTLEVVENFSLSCSDADAYQAGSLGYSNGLEGDCNISGSLNPVQTNNFDECGGTITVTWDGEDACGTPLSASQTITVDPAPEAQFINPSPSIEVICDLADDYIVNDLDYSNGLEGTCGINGSVPGVLSGSYDACGGTLYVDWKFVDDCGREIEYTKTITVLPAPAPEVTAPEFPSNIACDMAANFTAANATYTNGLSGLCELSGELEANVVKSYDACGGTITIDYSGSDACQNPLSAGPYTIVVDPAPAPEVTAPEFPSNIACDMAANFTAANATYSNGLEGTLCELSGEIEADVVKSYDACGGTITITYTGKDICDNDLSAGPYTIVVDPAPAPEVTAPQFPLDVECVDAEGFTAEDATYSNGLEGTLCELSGTIEADVVKSYDVCGGTITITYTGKDICDNDLAAGPYVIEVKPAPAPVFNPIEPADLACEDLATYVPEFLGYTNGIDGPCGINGQVQGVAQPFDGSCGTFDVDFSYESCGVTITAKQTITVIDETAPVLVGELPQGLSDVDACLADAPAPPTEEEIEALFSDNCGNVNATLEITSPEQNTDCLWAVLYRYTIVDDCGNYAAPVKIYHNGGDKTPPELVGDLPAGVTGLQCLSENPGAPDLGAIEAAYTDNCGDVIVTPFEPNIQGDDCGWTATYEYEIKDTCGNKLPNLVIENSGADTMAPVLEGEIPMGENTVNACIDSDLGEPTEEEIAALFSDNCADITADNVYKIEKLAIGDDCEWIRVFEYTVSDNCNNSYPTFKINYQGGDTEDPTFEVFPEDITIQCSEVEDLSLFSIFDYLNENQIPFPVPADNCSVTLEFEPDVVIEGQVCPIVAVCTKKFIATDGCGRSIERIFTVTILDNEGPSFNEELPQNIVIECGDEIPEAAVLTASDCTSADVEYIPGEEISRRECKADDAGNHTLWINNKNDLGASNKNWTAIGPTSFEQFSNGTAKLTGISANVDDPTQIFEFEAWFKEGSTYEEWIATPNAASSTGFRQPKLNAGTTNGATLADAETWSYYIMDESKDNKLVGQGAYAGVELSLSHNPANLVFGLQYGHKASLQSDGLGVSVWIRIEGDFMGSNYSSNGDFNIALSDCVEDPNFETNGENICDSSIVRTWIATDACGNETTHTQTITIVDSQGPEIDCPDDVDFGLVTEAPTEFADKALWTDNCSGTGETADYTDSDISVSQGEQTQIGSELKFIFEEGYILNFGSTPAGTQNDAPYYVGQVTDYNGNPLPGYGTMELIYFFEGQFPDFSVVQNGEEVGYGAMVNGYPSCDEFDWYFEENDGHTKAFSMECAQNEYTTEYSFTRTFYAEDDCGNGSNCSVTYTWNVSENIYRQSDAIEGELVFNPTNRGDKEVATEDSNIDFKAYPVPFDNEVTISYVFEYRTDVTIELFDTKGLLVTSITNDGYVAGSIGRNKIDLSNTPSQVLYVKLTTSKGTVTKKIVSSGK